MSKSLKRDKLNYLYLRLRCSEYFEIIICVKIQISDHQHIRMWLVDYL